MKITKNKLKQLIQEELKRILETHPGVGDLEADYEDRGHDPSAENPYPLTAQEVAEDFVNTLPGWLTANAPDVNYDEVSQFIILKDETR